MSGLSKPQGPALRLARLAALFRPLSTEERYRLLMDMGRALPAPGPPLEHERASRGRRTPQNTGGRSTA